MTWEELCAKAKEMGYSRANGLMHPYKVVLFFKDGVISIGEEVFTGRTYEQMYQIMKALQ